MKENSSVEEGDRGLNVAISATLHCLTGFAWGRDIGSYYRSGIGKGCGGFLHRGHESGFSLQPSILIRTLDSDIQPQATIDGKGIIHLFYFKGNARGGDIYYVKSL